MPTLATRPTTSSLPRPLLGLECCSRDSPYKGSLTYDGVIEMAQPTVADDPSGYHAEAVELMRKAKALKGHARTIIGLAW